MNDIITIFSQRLAGYLMYSGFVLGGTRPDENGSGRNLFFFKNSKELQEAMNNYRKRHKAISR